jgi:UDP-N-acetylglucosamine/UDP-N-acetylgalactosamine diphosphorylase
VDSAQSCRDDQLRQFARWLKSAGATAPVDATGLPALRLEVSPLFGYDVPSFLESWNKLSPAPALRDGLYLE